MVNKFEITIKDILKRDIFKNAQVIAGHKGLKNQVKWTHILETKKFETLINGGELILTTGAGLNLNNPESISFIEKLIKKNTAGICIELGTHVNSISKELLELSNRFEYPIIVFNDFVKFVDITQDLHSLIINKHHHLLKLLNELSMNFNELSLLPNGILKILEKLYSYTNGVALFITNKSKSIYYPPNTKNVEKKLTNYIMSLDVDQENRQSFTLEDKSYVFVLVKGSGITWGYLCLELVENALKSIIFPVLEQAALAIAQIVLRNRTIQERQQNAEEKLVRDLLYGEKINLNQLKGTFPILNTNYSYRLILMYNKNYDIASKKYSNEEYFLQKTILLRSIITQYGFFPAISVRKNEIAIIVFFNDSKSEESNTKNFDQIIDKIKKTEEIVLYEGSKYLLGISSERTDLAIINECYQEANKVLFLKKSNIETSDFYEKTGVYRLLLNQTKMNLESYVNDILQPLIDYDKDKNSVLLDTLDVFLECRSAKKEAAERLFIVRQTLYHRLNKIEELLGENYLKPDNRIALETAIKAYHILSFHKEIH